MCLTFFMPTDQSEEDGLFGRWPINELKQNDSNTDVMMMSDDVLHRQTNLDTRQRQRDKIQNAV